MTLVFGLFGASAPSTMVSLGGGADEIEEGCAVGKATVLFGLVATRPPSTPAAFMSDSACASLEQSRSCAVVSGMLT